MRSLFVLASLIAVLAGGCDGHTSVRGRVLDSEKKPITKATVRLTQQPDNPVKGRADEATTDEEGHFGVGITHAPTKTMPFLLEVTKDGFVRYEEKLTGTADYEKEIVLQPVKK